MFLVPSDTSAQAGLPRGLTPSEGDDEEPVVLLPAVLGAPTRHPGQCVVTARCAVAAELLPRAGPRCKCSLRKKRASPVNLQFPLRLLGKRGCLKVVFTAHFQYSNLPQMKHESWLHVRCLYPAPNNFYSAFYRFQEAKTK